MGFAFRLPGFRIIPALFAAAVFLGAAPSHSEPFLFFWDQSEPRAPQEKTLSVQQTKAILAREGARMQGKTRLRGAEIVAMGVDRAGRHKKFTLDAISGEVLDVQVVADPAAEKREQERKRRENAEDLTPPDAPLAPPAHAPDGASEPAPAAAQTPDKSTGKPAAGPVGDSQLSPIKPLRPAGAPKVEPLPQ